MTFNVKFHPEFSSAELTHFQDVSVEEIHASRLELAQSANANSARGAIINILDSEITASPVEIIENVEGLMADLRPGCKLAFVAIPEAQEVVSMIVTTVAHNHGAKVAGFADLDKARGWISDMQAT